MSDNSFIPKSESQQSTKSKRKVGVSGNGSSIIQIMNGDFLTREFVLKNMGFIFFVMFLLLLVVSKGYYVNQLAKEIKLSEEEISLINAEYVDVKANLEVKTRRTNLIQKLEGTGLKETLTPTKVIKVSTSKEE
jgi:hypothetical protein